MYVAWGNSFELPNGGQSSKDSFAIEKLPLASLWVGSMAASVFAGFTLAKPREVKSDIAPSKLKVAVILDKKGVPSEAFIYYLGVNGEPVRHGQARQYRRYPTDITDQIFDHGVCIDTQSFVRDLDPP